MDLPAGLRSTTVGGGILLSDIQNASSAGNLVFGGNAVDGSDDKQSTTHNWNVTLSQRMPGRILWEMSYVGNRSRNLTIEGDDMRDINKVPLGAMLGDPGGDANKYRPMPQYTNLRVDSHSFYSNYNALQTMATKQAGYLNLTLAYTWSKAMGLRDGPDRINFENNYMPLGFDRTHVFSSSYVVTVPDLVKGGGNPFAKHLANGWEIAGIVQWNSGVNLQANAGTNNFDLSTNSNSIVGTPYIRAQPFITCDPTKNLASRQYMNKDCFAPPIPGANGQMGVNGTLIFPYMSGPAFFNTDLSLTKNFKITESKTLQFRASAYNFPNHPVPSFISGDENLRLEFDAQGKVSRERFGYADYKVGKRIITLGVKFEF
jgi:hypothetical protein